MKGRGCVIALALVLATTIGACAGARVDPRFSAEPRLEATIEALGDELTRLRLERDSLVAVSDSLVACSDSLAALSDALRLELRRLKDIDLRPKRRPGRGTGGR